MEDNELSVLRANAERLMRSGTPAQQSAASGLMPAIDAEMVTRVTAKLTAKAELAALKSAKKNRDEVCGKKIAGQRKRGKLVS
ncbi:MAG: hypothetical protein HC834_05285 [Rhodospirillales bacterium]|nr:hypothetical protein [Rhodospirillales bacterium]